MNNGQIERFKLRKTAISVMGVMSVTISYSGVAYAAPAVGAAKAAAPAVRAAGPAKDEEHLRPTDGLFPGGGFRDTQWHFKGIPNHQAQITSKDVVFNMDLLDWDDKSKQGVATGSPRVVDAHNTVTADKMRIFDAGTPDVRKVVLDGHVRIVHRPDEAKDTKPSGDAMSDVFSHDVVLTCDHAEYYYRAKRSIATGHPKLEGLDTEKNKLVPVTLTADRLESEDKQNLYRAIGNAVVTEPDRSISSPQMTAVVEDQDGNRKVQTITLAPPVRFTGMIDDSEDAGAPTAAAGTATVGAAGVSASGTATEGGKTTSTGGTVTTGGHNPTGGTAPAVGTGTTAGTADGTPGDTTAGAGPKDAAGDGTTAPATPPPPPGAAAETTTPPGATAGKG